MSNDCKICGVPIARGVTVRAEVLTKVALQILNKRQEHDHQPWELVKLCESCYKAYATERP